MGIQRNDVVEAPLWHLRMDLQSLFPRCWTVHGLDPTDSHRPRISQLLRRKYGSSSAQIQNAQPVRDQQLPKRQALDLEARRWLGACCQVSRQTSSKRSSSAQKPPRRCYPGSREFCRLSGDETKTNNFNRPSFGNNRSDWLRLVQGNHSATFAS